MSAAARRTTWIALIAVAVCLPLLAGFAYLPKVNTQQGYRPVQPIPFSHALHAGQMKIDCQYCHFAAELSRHAGVPPTAVCMNCHRQVKKDSPYIKQIAQAVADDKPFSWVRVHRLPDFAWFSHANHVTAGIACQRCHGPVEKMDRIEQVEPMTMGWCLDCHRATDRTGRVPKAEGPAAASAFAVAADPPPHPLHPPTDCSACHR